MHLGDSDYAKKSSMITGKRINAGEEYKSYVCINNWSSLMFVYDYWISQSFSKNTLSTTVCMAIDSHKKDLVQWNFEF